MKDQNCQSSRDKDVSMNLKPFVLHKNGNINDGKVRVKEIWNFSVPCCFNTISVDVLFGNSGENSRSVILGGEDGIVRVYDNIHKLQNTCDLSTPVPKACLETKGGAIQCAAVHDVTRFYNNDLIVGHSTGMLTVFSNHHILNRRQLSDHSIDHLQVQQDPLGNITIVTSDDAGLITAMTPSSDLWRVNLNDIKHSKKPSGHVSVTCLLSVTLTSADGEISTCLLAADTASQLHVFRQGSLVLTLHVPSVVTAMCTGHFVDVSKLTINQTDCPPCKDTTQVALGTHSGNVYLMADFAISCEDYSCTGLPISDVQTLRLPSHDLDLLVCTGHFNSLQIFHDSQKVGEERCADWVNVMTVADVNGDGWPEVVIGCLDKTVHAFKVV